MKNLDAYKTEGYIFLDEYSYFIENLNIPHATKLAIAMRKFVEGVMNFDELFDEYDEFEKIYKELFSRLRDNWLGKNDINVSDFITVDKKELKLIMLHLDEEFEKFRDSSRNEELIDSLKRAEMSETELEALLAKLLEANKTLK